MAIYKVINEAGDYRTQEDVEKVLNYVTNPDKTGANGIFGGAVEPSLAAMAMNCVADAYEQNGGCQLRHSVLSFSPEENISHDQAKAIAQELLPFYSQQYQIVAAVHQDTPHPHIHLVMNTTDYTDGHKYRGTKKDYYDFGQYIGGKLKPYNTHVELRKHSRDKNSPNNHTESQDTDTIYHFYDEDDET